MMEFLYQVASEGVTVSSWIYCKDQMPEDRARCWVSCITVTTGKMFVQDDYWDEYEKMISPTSEGWVGMTYPDRVYAWMPFPEAPTVAELPK